MADDTILEGEPALDACLAAFAAAPARGALFCDIDGTVSPIAPTPAQAVVPDETRDLLTRLAARLGLVAFVTGRALEDGRRMIDVPGAAYVGTHGLEVRTAEGALLTEPQAERYVTQIRRGRRAGRPRPGLRGAGRSCSRTSASCWRSTTAWRPDAAATRHAILTRVVEPARARGLAIATGHFAFEVKPPLPFSKGGAVRRLLDADRRRRPPSCAATTSPTSPRSRRCATWAEQDARRSACAVAAVTAETPRSVADEADVQVRATPGVTEVLSRLLARVGG